MRAVRSLVAGLAAATALSLAAVPGLTGAALAATPLSVQASAGNHATQIRYLDFDHVVPSGATVHIRGQVVGHWQGQRGGLPQATVTLYRQLDKGRPWVRISSQPTGGAAYPQFNFATVARMNATYKVVFGGDTNFRGSQDTTWVTVYRAFHGLIDDGSRAATLHGHVTPYYNHKAIWLQKRSCASCDYVTVKKTTTGMAGAYSFDLPAPPSGRWWWRVAVPGTAAFMASYGGTFTTQTH